MKRIVRKRQLFNKRLVLNILLVLFMFLSIGYSTLSTNLNINGNLIVKKYYEPTLYNVLAKEAETGGLAREYTGSHHDSFTEEPSQKIYHWYAKNDTEGTQILDKNNVIFANHCWQMIRTTDTGGVKMIYNGEADDGKCLNTRGTHVGYAQRTFQNLASNYWYGTEYTYDTSNKTFKVSGTAEQVTWNATTGPDLIGKYTCKNTSVDGTCSTLYLVESYYNAMGAYAILLNSNSSYSQFGELQFNASSNSPAYVGYMYNTRYICDSLNLPNNETILSSSSIGINHWYSNSVTWGTPTPDRYNLDNPHQVSSATDYPNLVGEYTFGSTTQTYTYWAVRYIAAVNDATYYYIELGNESGSTHDLSFYNYTYTYGESYTDNGNGTYTINNPITINRSDWYSHYNDLKNKYVCKNAVGNTCSELRYITSTSVTSMAYNYVYKYANNFTWDGSNYVLDNDTSVSFWNIKDSNNKTSLNSAHYTCFNTNGTCTTLSYVYYIVGETFYYFNIIDGKNIETALQEMLYSNDVNAKNSTMKDGIDSWYKQYLSSYDSYIEDTIYCNDRTIINYGGWNPDGGSATGYLLFKSYNTSTDLSCLNITDQFSVGNNKAKLIYKVGLISASEVNLMNNSIVRKTGYSYLTFSPNFFINSEANGKGVNTSGDFIYASVIGSRGVRPAISLRPGIEYSSGTGSMADPYVVDTSGD